MLASVIPMLPVLMSEKVQKQVSVCNHNIMLVWRANAVMSAFKKHQRKYTQTSWFAIKQSCNSTCFAVLSRATYRYICYHLTSWGKNLCKFLLISFWDTSLRFCDPKHILTISEERRKNSIIEICWPKACCRVSTCTLWLYIYVYIHFSTDCLAHLQSSIDASANTNPTAKHHRCHTLWTWLLVIEAFWGGGGRSKYIRNYAWI